MKTIEYFFECYFNMSADYNELEQLVKEFNGSESETYVVVFKQELSEVVKLNKWDIIVEVASNKGGRTLAIEKAEILTRYLLGLAKGDANIARPDLYRI